MKLNKEQKFNLFVATYATFLNRSYNNEQAFELAIVSSEYAAKRLDKKEEEKKEPELVTEDKKV
jgi:hypothetical protein